MYRVFDAVRGMAITVPPRGVRVPGTEREEATMANVDPGRFANENQALHPQTEYPHFGEYDGSSRRKRKPIRNLVRRILGRGEKKDQ